MTRAKTKSGMSVCIRPLDAADALEGFSLSRIAGIAAVPPECALDPRALDGQAVPPDEIEQRHSHVRGLIGAGIAVGQRDGHAVAGHDRASLAATPGSLAARAEHDQRAG